MRLNRKKIFTSIFIVLSILFLSITNVQAASSIKASLNNSTEVEKVKVGQEIVLTLKFDEYQEINKGINSYKATLDYNREIFEEVEQGDFIGLNDWEEIRYNKDNGEFVAIKKAGSKSPEEVMKITLKVKTDAEPGESTISVNDVVCSEGIRDIPIREGSKKVEVVKDAGEEPDNPKPPVEPENPDQPDNPNNPDKPDDSGNPSKPSNPDNPNKPDNPENPDNPSTPSDPSNPNTPSDSSNLNKPSTPENPSSPGKPENPSNPSKSGTPENLGQAPGKIPATGKYFTGLFILIAIEIIFAITAYIKYQKIRIKERKISKKTMMFITIFCAVAISAQFIGTTYAAISKLSQKGDVNLDGQINIHDIRLLEEHLIGLNILTDDQQLENAEFSGDGKITVTDLTCLVKKVEDLTQYQVDLANIEVRIDGQENYYPEKNKEMTIAFISAVSPRADIEAITINNQEYSVKDGTLNAPDENNNEYTIKLNSGNTAGVQNYKFTKVILNTGKEVEIDYTLPICVLKPIPAIENYKVVEDIHGKAFITFDLIDEEDSATLKQVTVSKKLEDKEETIETREIVKGNNAIDVLIEDGQTYQVDIVLNYNLATEQLADKEKDCTGSIIINKSFKADLDYKFKISNIKTLNGEEEANVFAKKEPIKISFESTNASSFEPSTVKINGKGYTVEKEDGKYITTIDGLQNIGENTITIEAVTLNNGKEITVDKNVTVTIDEKRPLVKNFETQENLIQRNINVKFDIEDEAKTIQTARIELCDGEGKIIGTPVEITAEDLENGTIEKSLPTDKTDAYIIKVIATYKEAPEDIIEDSILHEEIVDALIFADITKSEISKKDSEKNGTVDITYKIATNSKIQISKILVNSVYYNAEKLSDREYKVTVSVGEEAGLIPIKATQVVFKDETVATVLNIQKIDVLKDTPRIQEIKQEDDLTSNKVTVSFKLIDSDNALVKSADNNLIKVKLVKLKDGKETQELIEPIETVIDENGNGRVVFEHVEEGEKYIAKFTADYNRYNENPEKLLENQLIEKEDIQLIRDYNLQVSNIKTANQNKETKYFNKDEEVVFSFTATTGTSFIPEKAIIKTEKDIAGKQYTLTRKTGTDTYQVKLPSYAECGAKEIKIETIILNNKKFLDLSENNIAKLEVLKDKPTITNFAYRENTENTNQIIASFKLNDSDNAFTSGRIIITDEKEAEIANEALTPDFEELTINKSSSEFYKVKVVANYDLDTNELETGKNEYKDQILLDEEITLKDRMIEMKDVSNVILYKKEDGTLKEIQSELDKKDLKNNKDLYIAKVQMKDLPDFYATIKDSYDEGKKFKLKLNYEKVTQYDGNNKSDELVVTYDGVSIGDTVRRYSLEEIIEGIKENDRNPIYLFQDYDASGLEGNGYSILGDFRGKVYGNGHTIYNLSKPLFDTLEYAEVENLVLEDVILAGKDRYYNKGALANQAYGCTIKNVHVKNATIIPNTVLRDAGGIVGELKGSNNITSTMKECSVINLNILGNGTKIGGLVGDMNKATIENCYVIGNINSKDTAIGGLVGYANNNSVIRNCISKVTINTTARISGNGGIVGNTANFSTKLENNVSLSTGGNGYRVYGSFPSDYSTNNYEVAESSLTSNASDCVRTVSKNNITADFFRNHAKFNENVWNLENVSYNKLPVLKNTDPNRKGFNGGDVESTSIYIPDYDRLKSLPDYDSNKEIAYSNLYKLMPFHDAKYLVIDGKNIGNDHILNTKLIKTVLPYNADGDLITVLTENTKNSISYIKIVFTDDTTKDYKVKFKNYYGHIATYEISELKIEYNYDKYVINENSKIVKDLTAYIQNLNYSSTLEKVASVDYGKRIYRDYFNETTKKNAKDFVLKYLQNVNGNSITINDTDLDDSLTNDLINSNKFKQILFAYNYYSRWYDIDIKGTNIADLMLFKGEFYSDSMGIEELTKELMSNNKYRNSPHTKYLYRDNIGARSGCATISSFIDYNIEIFGDYEKPDDWFTENFSGILVEIPVEGRPDIDYRAWTQLKKQEDFLLPILTLPENAGYMMSAPTMFLVGSQKIYIENPQDENQRQQLLNKIKDYGTTYISTFYTTTAGFIEPEYMNRFADVQMDKSGIIGGTEEKDGKTQDPFNKNFYEAMYEWPTIGGVAAYAQEGKIHWVAYNAIGAATYGTWSHESGHNQAAKLFLKNNGRRPSGGTVTIDEDYTDGNTAQRFGDGDVHFNLTYNYPVDAMITTNLTTERINSKTNIESYYKKMFEAIDFLDYVEAKAFLQLTPEEQSKVAVQAYYIGADVGWKALSKEEFEKMNLKTIENIYDNQIMINPGSQGTTKSAYGSYGSEGMYIRRWYQPHNDSGRTYSHGLKYTAWQMLGAGGYDNGYVTYYSGKSKTDLDAIKQITGKSSWKEYKLSRYDLMEKNWNNAYLNSNELVEKYVQALKEDARANDRNVTNSTNVRRTNYHYLKRVTNDFREEVLTSVANVTHISSAQEFKDKITQNPMGYYVLDKDIDLSSFDTGDSIIRGCFAGKLDGNGHKLIGNTIPIFNNIKFAHICNLNIEGSNIVSDIRYVGALSKETSYTKIENVTVSDVKVSAQDEAVGGLVGIVTNSNIKNVHITKSTVSGASRTGLLLGYVGTTTIQECSTSGTSTATGNSAGGFIGEAINNTIIKNCYSLGTVTGAKNVGGFVGYLNKSSITNCFSSTTATGTSAVGGFVGQTAGESTIQNNISLSNQKAGYKFDGGTLATQFAGFSGNYEYEENKGISTLIRAGIDFTQKISVATKQNATDPNFYTSVLGWDASIWNFDNVINEATPTLQKSKLNDSIKIVTRYTVSNVDEFIEKISADPDGIFIITNDIDFTGKSYNCGSSVITQTFTGKIEGNNHTILNLKNASLFNQFNGRVYDLNISNFEHGAYRWEQDPNIILLGGSDRTKDNVSAFAKKAANATFYNMKFDNIILLGRDRLGIVVGEDTNSTFEKISVKNSYGNAKGSYASTFIAIKHGGKIKNCYVQGELKISIDNAGGIMGVMDASQNPVIVENVISNVKIFSDNKIAGGFVGAINAKQETIIKNSMSIGAIEGSAGKQEYKKFTSASNDIIEKTFQNCYENAEEQGISNANGTNIKEATKEQLLDKNFYINTLGFDETIWNLDAIQEKDYTCVQTWTEPTIIKIIDLDLK